MTKRKTKPAPKPPEISERDQRLLSLPFVSERKGADPRLALTLRLNFWAPHSSGHPTTDAMIGVLYADKALAFIASQAREAHSPSLLWYIVSDMIKAGKLDIIGMCFLDRLEARFPR